MTCHAVSTVRPTATTTLLFLLYRTHTRPPSYTGNLSTSLPFLVVSVNVGHSETGHPSALSCNIRTKGEGGGAEREVFNGKQNFKMWPNSEMWSIVTRQNYIHETSKSRLTVERLLVTICTAQRSLYVPPRLAHTVYLCVLCGSQNKQPLFPYTTLIDWFV